MGLAPERAKAAARLREACAAHPWHVAGTGRFCTEIMERFGARIFVKTGAEGVYCAALPEQGLGIAVKCDDGAGRAAEVMMAATLVRLAAARSPTAGRWSRSCGRDIAQLERHRGRRNPADRSAYEDVSRIAGAAMLSIITLMQAGLPLASARSIAPGRSAARSTCSPWPPSAATTWS